MKFKNVGIIIVLSLIVLGFSSCEEDRWHRSTLTYSSYNDGGMPLTDRDGNFGLDLQLDLRDINTYESMGRVSDIRMYDSHFLFESGDFRSKDALYIRLENNYSRRVYEGPMVRDGNKIFVVDTRDPKYAAFIDDLMFDLSRGGRVMLYVDMTSNIR